MKKKLLIVAAIVALPTMNSVAFATDSITNQIAQDPSKAVESRTENLTLDYSARKILGYVSEARVALSNKQKQVALAYIDSALVEIGNIKDMKNYLEMLGTSFGRVSYGESDSYYIPIADDTYAVRSYTSGPFWSEDKTRAVQAVELVTVDIAINPEKATKQLQAAKKQTTAEEYTDANDELKTLLNESIKETASKNQPFIRLQDNIYLTRILIRQQNYDGARYTLKHAKDALNDYDATVVSAPGLRTNISNLRKEIDGLDTVLKQRDPTILEKSADTVDKWWTDLKSWAKEKE